MASYACCGPSVHGHACGHVHAQARHACGVACAAFRCLVAISRADGTQGTLMHNTPLNVRSVPRLAFSEVEWCHSHRGDPPDRRWRCRRAIEVRNRMATRSYTRECQKGCLLRCAGIGACVVGMVAGRHQA
jgi:hypothetical protein